MISRVAYGGWANNVLLSNGQLELLATLDVGPRVLRFAFAGGANMLKEYPEQLGGTGEDEWMIRGGHRLWTSPEDKPRTYGLDNAPVTLEELGDYALRLTPAPEVENSVQKQLEISMAANTNRVTITHRITNIGRWEIELAPWALSVMAPGGTCIVPLPEKRPHTEVLAPEFPLVLWPYTDLADARFRWGTRYITFTQHAQQSPAKFGLSLQAGWAAYQLQRQLFIKSFDFEPYAEYPDMGCNFETFSNEEMLEVESLGPLTLLAPGDTVEHTETWRLFADVPTMSDDASIDAIILPLVSD